jgi:hypothetical protein
MIFNGELPGGGVTSGFGKKSGAKVRQIIRGGTAIAKDSSLRRISTVMISMGRKNAKSQGTTKETILTGLNESPDSHRNGYNNRKNRLGRYQTTRRVLRLADTKFLEKEFA